MKERLPYWDNLKGFLIFLVVFGHLLQLTTGGSETAVYKLIYLFHMPLFVFCSGALASFALKKMLKSLLLPYTLLQPVCCLCTGQPLQWSTPYWMLWYLPALFVWRMCVPLLNKANGKAAFAVVFSLLLLGCMVGFTDQIGYAYTLSRIFVFAPYFAAGYYARKYSWFYPEHTYSRRTKWSFAVGLLFLCTVFVLLSPSVNAEWFYGTYSYSAGEYSMWLRAAQYITCGLIGSAILLLTPKKQTVFTAWGRESFALYIAHIALLPIMEWFFNRLAQPQQMILCIPIATAFCMLIPALKSVVRKSI